MKDKIAQLSSHLGRHYAYCCTLRERIGLKEADKVGPTALMSIRQMFDAVCVVIFWKTSQACGDISVLEFPRQSPGPLMGEKMGIVACRNGDGHFNEGDRNAGVLDFINTFPGLRSTLTPQVSRRNNERCPY